MTIDARRRDRGYVYGIRSLELIKIGVADDIEKRMKIMGLSNPHGLKLVFYRNVFAPFSFERRIHQILADKAVGREWFRVTLDELRKAAARAKPASNLQERSAQRHSATWESKINEIVLPATQSFININDIKELR